MAGPVKTWTLAYTRERYMAEARRVGGTPRSADLPQCLMQAITRVGKTLATMADDCGLQRNEARGYRVPLPENVCVPVDIERVKDADLARELKLHLERMKRRFAANPPQPRIRVNRSRRGDFHGVRWDRTADFLPPDDLNPKRRVR